MHVGPCSFLKIITLCLKGDSFVPIYFELFVVLLAPSRFVSINASVRRRFILNSVVGFNLKVLGETELVFGLFFNSGEHES